MMTGNKNKPTYLFVCLANMNRSPTAAEVFKGLARRRGKEVVSLSAGVSPLARQPLNASLVARADLIFVMEDYMKESMLRDFDVEEGRIVVLDIPDIYEKDDPVLVKQLRDVLEPYAGSPV